MSQEKVRVANLHVRKSDNFRIFIFLSANIKAFQRKIKEGNKFKIT